MLTQVLFAVQDTADYQAVLSMLKADGPLSREDADRLVEIYEKALPEGAGADFARLCVAVDLLPGRSRADEADFAALELGTDTLDALFTAQEAAEMGGEAVVNRADAILERVRNEHAGLPARALLARVALDYMAVSRDCGALREPISELAGFLLDCGEELLERCSMLVGEVRQKCG